MTKDALYLRAWEAYAHKLEDLVKKTLGDKPLVHLELHRLWLDAVEEAMNTETDTDTAKYALPRMEIE